MNQFRNEPYRPQFHFTPPTGWMNDPNGLVYFEDEYHLFYQHLNPKKHWGHAVSLDLIHWTDLPIAIAPDANGDVWSGSIVVDLKDTSGFFNGGCGLVAIYTSHLPDSQRQSLAYSTDRGRTWTKYRGNPVLLDANQPDFRDPKVFWHTQTQTWVMILATGSCVSFYRSPNLIDWTFESKFGQGHGVPNVIWECPDLFELPVDREAQKTKWVLLTSCVGPENFQNGFGLCTTQYFVGEFHGDGFVNDNPPNTLLYATQGMDDYAAITWGDQSESDARRIAIGWMSHWGYANVVPTHPWQGAMTLPRVLELKTTQEGIRLFQHPIPELQELRREQQNWRSIIIAPGENPFATITGELLEIVAEVQIGTASEFGIRVRVGSHEQTTIGYDITRSRLFIDRSQSGVVNFHPDFAQRNTARLEPINGIVSLHIFVDHSSVEVFANLGQLYFSELIFPSQASHGLELYSIGGEIVIQSLSLSHLQ